MRQIKLVDMGGRRQRVQGNRLRIIRIQIPFGAGTFLGHAGGVRGDDAKLVVSRDIDEKHLQKVMAYLFVTILFLFDFAKHQLGKVQQMLFFSGIIIVTVVLRGLRTAEGEGQSLNAEYDVLQRFGIHGFFRVFHVGINDDHVVFLNRDQLVFYQEFSQAADDIEQLGEVMGVGKTLPVAFVFGGRGIQKLEIQFLERFEILVKIQSFITHRGTSLFLRVFYLFYIKKAK
ncbi:hypothetical protein CLOSTHATH_01262 [Hungatella hathewayi DSM 13479]|uniref:Uncharacterized protein n=1 Tax=Hungatella hathewayi DSM 13479 TaxID=566550 RepID=D3ACD4_9FIRM|nr:hypothetical protein CLOSTHATH_01262 [Hungatella hathewayi DSM 13479]